MVIGDKTSSTLTTHHVRLCPRFGLLCECENCHPPVCLCALMYAITVKQDAETVRIAFYAAAKEAMG